MPDCKVPGYHPEKDLALVMTCLKFTENRGKPDFEAAAKELGISAKTLYHQHWTLLKKWGLTGSKAANAGSALASNATGSASTSAAPATPTARARAGGTPKSTPTTPKTPRTPKTPKTPKTPESTASKKKRGKAPAALDDTDNDADAEEEEDKPRKKVKRDIKFDISDADTLVDDGEADTGMSMLDDDGTD